MSTQTTPSTEPAGRGEAAEGSAGGHGGTTAIIAALLANLGIAAAKFVAFLVTGASSMLAEAIHSVADFSAVYLALALDNERALGS